MRKLMLVAGAAMLFASPSFAANKPCHGPNGKFIRCPAKAAPAAPKKCRNAKGHFAKCGTPGSHPA